MVQTGLKKQFPHVASSEIKQVSKRAGMSLGAKAGIVGAGVVGFYMLRDGSGPAGATVSAMDDMFPGLMMAIRIALAVLVVVGGVKAYRFFRGDDDDDVNVTVVNAGGGGGGGVQMGGRGGNNRVVRA